MTDFGKILDEWDGMRSHPQPKKRNPSKSTNAGGARTGSSSAKSKAANDFASALAQYLPGESDVKSETSHVSSSPRPKQKKHPRNWPVDASIDLHGFTAEEAEDALLQFLKESLQRNRRKLLIVHGKGLHSQGEPVLRSVVFRVLDSFERAGMRGPADKTQGGSGALWVVLK